MPVFLSYLEITVLVDQNVTWFLNIVEKLFVFFKSASQGFQSITQPRAFVFTMNRGDVQKSFPDFEN